MPWNGDFLLGSRILIDRLVNFIWASILLINDEDQFRDGVFQSISIDKPEPRSSFVDAFANDSLYSCLCLDEHPTSNPG